jgi:glutamyl-tRNA reductase
MTKHIFAAEICFDGAPNVREVLFDESGLLRFTFRRVRQPLEEVFVISTSNRFVVYAVGESIDPLLNFFLQEPSIFNCVHFYKNTEASIGHLLATACGLCCPVQGEPDIMEEIENAFCAATSCGTIGVILHKVVRKVLATARLIHEETGLNKIPGTILDAAIELIYNEMKDVYNRHFLIVGSSPFTLSLINSLVHEGISNITLATEPRKISLLKEQLPITFITLAEAVHFTALADIIIITGENTPFSKELVCLPNTSTKLILDLTSAEEAVKNHAAENVQKFNLSDLREINCRKPEVVHAIEDAWKVISTEAVECSRLVQRLCSAPALTLYFSRISKRELEPAKPARSADLEKNLSLMQHCYRKLVQERDDQVFFSNMDRQMSIHQLSDYRNIDFASLDFMVDLN